MVNGNSFILKASYIIQIIQEGLVAKTASFDFGYQIEDKEWKLMELAVNIDLLDGWQTWPSNRKT